MKHRYKIMSTSPFSETVWFLCRNCPSHAAVSRDVLWDGRNGGKFTDDYKQECSNTMPGRLDYLEGCKV